MKPVGRNMLFFSIAQSRFNLEPIILKRGLNRANIAPIGFPVFFASAPANNPYPSRLRFMTKVSPELGWRRLWPPATCPSSPPNHQRHAAPVYNAACAGQTTRPTVSKPLPELYMLKGSLMGDPFRPLYDFIFFHSFQYLFHVHLISLGLLVQCEKCF